MFTNGAIIILFWVDDYTFYAPDKQSIDDIIISLKYEILLEREEDMIGFLGLQIERESKT